MLRKIKELKGLIYCKELRIKNLWSNITYAGVSYDIRVQSSRNFNATTDKIVKIVELEEELINLRKELKELDEKVRHTATQLNDEKLEKIVILRYLEGKSWKEISQNLGITERWAMSLNKKALKKLSF